MRQWTILFHPDCDRRPRILTGSAPFPMERRPRASSLGEHHRRWGFPPRPESLCIVNAPGPAVKRKQGLFRYFQPDAQNSRSGGGDSGTSCGPQAKRLISAGNDDKGIFHILRQDALAVREISPDEDIGKAACLLFDESPEAKPVFL